MSEVEHELLLKEILVCACNVFPNLKVNTVSELVSLGLKEGDENDKVVTFEIVRKDDTHFFPAVGGKINEQNDQFKTIDILSHDKSFRAQREENVVSNPVKVVVSSCTWSAHLVAFGRNLKKNCKLACLVNQVWEIEKDFIEFLRKVSAFGSIQAGGVKACCGITVDEFDSLKVKGVAHTSFKRQYPAGAYVYEGPNCELLININQKFHLPAYPFHRCQNCHAFIRRRVKRKYESQSQPKVKRLCAKNIEEADINPHNTVFGQGFNMASPIKTSMLTPKIVRTPTNITSRVPIRFLTPTTQKKRLLNLKKKRKAQMNEIIYLRKRLTKFEVNLSEKQSKELEHIVSKIDSEFKDDLNEVLNENPKTRTQLRQIWKKDRLDRHCEDIMTFKNDQKKYVTGNRGNKWSLITYRIALSVYIRSPAAYAALKSFHILNLPSESTLKQFTSNRLDKPGISNTYLESQRKLYAKIKNEQEEKGLQVPLGEGILIFDEVRVIGKIMWNSKNHEITGYAMSELDFTMLGDIYEQISGAKENETRYILQFLWRDLSHNFDVLGPYFTFSGTVNRKNLYTCLMNTIRIFEFNDFHVRACVCDGASTNLSIIKFTMGHPKKSFGKKDGSHVIDPSFDNPFWPGHRINWVICPTHELKSLINQLHASRHPQGARNFKSPSGVCFGWSVIEKHYDREVVRMKKNLPKLVKNLQKSYIERDSWTKLNVKPAKIMQQEEMLMALLHYAKPPTIEPCSSDSKSAEVIKAPADAPEVLAVYDYLKACNYIFERGILQRFRLWRLDHPVLERIEEGFNYFAFWIDAIENDPDFEQAQFISWQTWDLLRVMYYGFRNLAQDYLEVNPGYFLSPGKINGSAVETLFSQFKFSAAGKLSGINYATARRAFLIKRDIHGMHFSHGDYRSTPLAVAHMVLEKGKPKVSQTNVKSKFY